MLLPFVFLAATIQIPAANPDDVKTEDSIVKAVYSVISGPAGEKRNWERFRSLFDAKGSMCAIVKNTSNKWVSIPMTPEEYIEKSGPTLERYGFFERESKRKSIRTLDIVNILSDYESRMKPDDKESFEKGTNSFQLYSDGKRWYVHSILWQDAPKPK